MPWAVLFMALALTLAGVMWRKDATTTAEAATRESAEGHFHALVADQHQLVLDAQNEIELTLYAASTGSPSLDEVRLRLIDADGLDLPGLVSYSHVDADGHASRVIGAADTDRMAELAARTELHRGVVVDTTYDGLVDVVRPHSDGTLLIATFDSQEFLLGKAAHQGHQVVTTITPLVDGPIPDPASSGETFSTVRAVQVFNERWLLDVTSTTGFFSFPTSNEASVVAMFGLALSVLLFALTSSLAHSRSKAEQHMAAAEAEARASAARFSAGFDASPIGVGELDLDGVLLRVNQAMAHLLGLGAEELVGSKLDDLVVDADAPGDDARSSGPAGNRDRKYRHSNGETIWVRETSTPCEGPDGAMHLLVQMIDVSEQHQVRRELQRRVLHDELTGLPNRTLLDDRMEQALIRARRTGKIVAVMFIDLDNFKVINDSMGHRAGDEVILEAARRLSRATRASDTVARFGGDEFVMLCEEIRVPADADDVAERIATALSEPMVVRGREVTTSASIGIALSEGSDSPGALLRDADLAMYEAKQAGRDRAVVFEGQMRSDLIDSMKLEDELLAALGRDELRLHYQPIADANTRQVVGFEALVRWEHPTRGLLNPADFIEVAERLRIIDRIDGWAVAEATEQLAKWTKTVPDARNWRIAVNAAARNFADHHYGDLVEEALDTSGLEPRRLVVELTENAILANTASATAMIRRFRRLGVSTAIDDFGTGYSSLSQLANLDVDILKIDRTFVSQVENDKGLEIIRVIVDMARTLGLSTIAEGVETDVQATTLAQLGAEFMQGFHIARPAPAQEAIAGLLADTN